MCDLNVTVSSNMERLMELLEDRDYDYDVKVNKDDPSDWIVQFVADRKIPGESIFHFITPKTKVADLWWLS